MIYKYGNNLINEQIEEAKKKLHKEIHWLLIYKDPKEEKKYSHVDFKKYFENVMRRIDGLNSLLLYPDNIVLLLENLEAAYLETSKEIFDFQIYRGLIFDAQTQVDKIRG